MKYRESKTEAVRGQEFGTEQINHKKKLKFIWDDRKRREKDCWKILWQNMVNCFGEGKCSKGETQIWKMAKRDRRKEILKQKSEERGSNYRLQKAHLTYRCNLSEISNEVWKKKWNNKIVWRYKYLHPKEEKEKETIYKGIISLHPKEDMKQFEK
jgi:hypothetical protein